MDDVSRCLDEGKTNKEIATELGISPTTTRKYTKEILNRQTNSVKHHRVASIELTQEQLEVLYGSLLGDMSTELKLLLESGWTKLHLEG